MNMPSDGVVVTDISGNVARLNKQGVASDLDFTLQRVDRYTFEYREGDRSLPLKGESMFSGLGGASFGFSFDPSWRTTEWQSPNRTSPISKVDRERIMKNIEQAMAF